MNCGRNRGSYADQNIRARAESYGEAVQVVHSIPLERIPVGQIVDMQEPQVMEKTSRVPKITQQVEYTQYQLQLVSG